MITFQTTRQLKLQTFSLAWICKLAAFQCRWRISAIIDKFLRRIKPKIWSKSIKITRWLQAQLSAKLWEWFTDCLEGISSGHICILILMIKNWKIYGNFNVWKNLPVSCTTLNWTAEVKYITYMYKNIARASKAGNPGMNPLIVHQKINYKTSTTMKKKFTIRVRLSYDLLTIITPVIPHQTIKRNSINSLTSSIDNCRLRAKYAETYFVHKWNVGLTYLQVKHLVYFPNV